MGRIRTIKPEFPQSETIGRLSRDARLLFIQLWTICDDSGRARAASRMLASLLYPYDLDSSKLMDGWLKELESQGCIRRYTVEGSSYLEICKWLTHQKIDHPSQSRLPAFEESSRGLHEDSSLDLGPRTMDLSLVQLPDGNGHNGHSRKKSPFPIEDLIRIYEAYPRHRNRAPALKAIEKALTRIEGDDRVAQLLDVTERFAKSPAGRKGVYTPHAATWFNASGFADDQSEWQKEGRL